MNEIYESKKCEEGVRNRYAKKWEKTPLFELYVSEASPGLSSIFCIGDQKSLNNWSMEFGPEHKKKGQIREALDHQINAPVMEITGNHDGSVCLTCPPDPKQTIDIKKPYVTILMRHIQGYSSIEFTALDTLGFSRKIHAKNFKSRCAIGELNCEIPMRLSSTWSYACVNLDKILMNAFGTNLATIQRIKINANCRVKRVFFSEELVPFVLLPPEYKIKLSLTPHEKKEVDKHDQLMSDDPLVAVPNARHAPWSLPELPLPDINKSEPVNQQMTNPILRRNMLIKEIASQDVDLEKYKYPKDPRGSVTDSNSKLLRSMLEKSIPPSKLLLPTLSLIYPGGKKGQIEDEKAHAEKLTEYTRKKGGGVSFRTEMEKGKHNNCEEDYDEMRREEKKKLAKLKQCFEKYSIPSRDRKNSEKAEEEEMKKNNALTDWDMINHQDHHENENEQEESHKTHHHHHHHIHGCKYNTIDLARYLKHREAVGEYDLFTGTLGNPSFLAEEEMELETEKEELNPITSEAEVIPLTTDVLLKPGDSNPFIIHQRHTHGAIPASRKTSPSRSTFDPSKRSTISRLTLQDPSRAFHQHQSHKIIEEAPEVDDAGGGGDTGSAEQLTLTPQESDESWVLTWAYTGLSWAQTREINQRLLRDAQAYRAGENERATKRSILEYGFPNKQQQKHQNNIEHSHMHRSILPDFVKIAGPVMPKVMKEELRGTSGYYDLVFDNPTLPIAHY